MFVSSDSSGSRTAGHAYISPRTHGTGMIRLKYRPLATGEMPMGGERKCGVRLDERKGESPVG